MTDRHASHGVTTSLLAWGRSNQRTFPWRKSKDPFRILVAEFLLQRSRSKTVAKVFQEIFRRWPGAPDLALAPVPSIRSVIRPLGLVTRAATLRALARAVVELGEVPHDIQALRGLPGIGPYAANATAVVAFGKRVPTVDSVSARVYRRYFGLPSDLPASQDHRLWDVAEESLPNRNVREWNWAVLDLAATICLPKRPRCEECPVQAGCAYAARMRVSGLG